MNVIKINKNTEKREYIYSILERHQIGYLIHEDEDHLFIMIQEELTDSTLHVLDEEIIKIEEPYVLVNRKLMSKDQKVNVNDVVIGQNEKFVVIAGPCSVESESSLRTLTQSLKESGASVIRGGAFKPRTSPYSFDGLKEEGIDILSKITKEHSIGNVSEIMDAELLELYDGKIDMLQIGARNMQNFALLEKISKTNYPVLLKRGFSNTLEELLLAAEYLVNGGNKNVVLCERGIRTFEPYTRNTLDLSVITILKQRSNLPVIVDPSHATGDRTLVEKMALAAYVVGADGIMLEVSENPEDALSDADQAISLETFDRIMKQLKELSTVIKREVE